MNIESVIMIVSVLVSVVALFFSIRKQSHDESNIDADTISKLYDTVDKQEKRYRELRQEFDQYKVTTSHQITEIAAENVKLRSWARRLINQLEKAGITPVKYDDM